MTVFCLIPAKPHAEAKTRLSPVLTQLQRVELSHWLLRRTLRLARAVVGPVVVVSRDSALLADAEARGAWGLFEAAPGLNPALSQAARFAQARGAGGLLVLPTDLPWLTAADLAGMLALAGCGAGRQPARQPPQVLVIAPCRHGTGTNALLMRPPDLVPFAFGPGSFAVHCAAARAGGVEPVVCRGQGLAFDLDTPEDWQLGIRKWDIRDWGPESGD